jgi:hypothetical protein
MFFVGKLSLRDVLFMIDIVYYSDFSLHAYIISWKNKKENVFLYFFLMHTFPLKYHMHAHAYMKKSRPGA